MGKSRNSVIIVAFIGFILLGSSIIPQSFADVDVEFSNLRIVDVFGNKILNIEKDQSVQFTADITNNQQVNQDFAYVLTTDELERVFWITGSLSPGQVLSPALSHVFKSNGIFTVYLYLTYLPADVLDENNPTDYSPFSNTDNQLAPPLSIKVTIDGPTSKSSSKSNEPEPKPVLSFVDKSKDLQDYIDRYNNESEYKEWFDRNYPDYTIYEAVGLSNPKVPEWIKNNAKWWSENQIEDSDFTFGIAHLIKEKIIDIPDLPQQASQNFESNDEDATEDTIVPDWVRNNAAWWADDLISEDEFLNGIKYLVEKKIIRV